MTDQASQTSDLPRDANVLTIKVLREQAAELPMDAFAAFIGTPVLVSAPPSVDLDDDWSFRTGSYTAVRDDESGVVFDLGDDHEVRPLKKRAESLFKDTILVGRTDSCDVVVRDASISKLHARIRIRDNGATYIVTDAGSSNGTFVDKQRLAPEEEMQLPDAGILMLGSRVFHVLSPERLWRLLEKLSHTHR